MKLLARWMAACFWAGLAIPVNFLANSLGELALRIETRLGKAERKFREERDA